jgi:hypothetical protein
MRAKINTMRPDGTHRDDVFAEFARALETELAAVTKQRDELAEALKNILADARLTLPTIKAAVGALKSIEEGEP